METVSYDNVVFRDSSKIFLKYILTFQHQLKIPTEFLNKCSKHCINCGIVLLFKSLEIPYPEIESMWARSQLLPYFNGGFIQVSGKLKKKNNDPKPNNNNKTKTKQKTSHQTKPKPTKQKTTALKKKKKSVHSFPSWYSFVKQCDPMNELSVLESLVCVWIHDFPPIRGCWWADRVSLPGAGRAGETFVQLQVNFTEAHYILPLGYLRLSSREFSGWKRQVCIEIKNICSF